MWWRTVVSPSMRKGITMKKLILDLDTGVDDALAISYALGSPEIELRVCATLWP